MAPDEAAHSTSSPYHFVHLAPEEIEHLLPDELLQACLEYRNLLLAIMGVLYTPDADLTSRVVAIDLLYTQAQRISQEQVPDEAQQVVYNIKQVSDRLGLRPHVIRKAYEQLEERGALHIDAKSFPTKRKQQLPLPLDTETTDNN
ncbi:MAG: hypothetical protein ACJ797_04600 [Ktedonobacteraceae bacterium]